MNVLYNVMKNKGIVNNTTNHFAVLKVFFPEDNLYIRDDELVEMYKNKAAQHNSSVMNNPFTDSGVDLFLPYRVNFEGTTESQFVDLKIKAVMTYCDVTLNTLTPCPFQIYPRSSISKTPLMLANHTGIIDSGYRGNLIAAFRNLDPNRYSVDKYIRLVQICHPTLCPIFVTFANNENEFSSTERNAGGFGSTG